jgi:hypothetical protein
MRLERRIGTLSAETMEQLKDAPAFSWILNGLPNERSPDPLIGRALPLGRIAGISLIDAFAWRRLVQKRASGVTRQLDRICLTFRWLRNSAGNWLGTPGSWSYCGDTANRVTNALEPIGSHLLEFQVG